MNTVGQTQQAVIQEKPRSTSSLSPLVSGYPWHMHRSDFEAICEGDACNADALRGFETKTDARVGELRRFDGVPDNRLPHEDDLWLEVSARDLARWTVDAWGKTKYSEILDETRHGQTKSLFELGFLRRRIVAYPARYELESVETTIYRDIEGNAFIIVDDDAGNYANDQGGQCNAKDQGYSVIRRQYLYCIDKVNAALAKLVGQSPPKPLERWHSLQKKKGSAGETTNPTPSKAQPVTSQSTAATPNDDNQRGGKASMLFDFKNNINIPSLSLDSDEKNLRIVELHNNSSIALLRAPWTAETFYGLLACHLDVPDPESIDEDRWAQDWEMPRQWLFAENAHLDCARAWEDIELNTCAMLSELGGPTWHAREASTPFTRQNLTLRHVVGTKKNSRELDGHNWTKTIKALKAESWKNYEHVEYYGPPLFGDDPAESPSAQSEPSIQDYARGYGAQSTQPPVDDDQSTLSTEHTTQSVEVTAQSSIDDTQSVDTAQSSECAVGATQNEETTQTEQSTEALEAIAQPENAQCATSIVRRKRRSPGMTQSTAQSLIDRLRKDYPMLALRMVDVALGFYVVRMQTGDDQRFDFERVDDAQSSAAQHAIDQAECYGRQRTAVEDDGCEDSQGPPGYGGE